MSESTDLRMPLDASIADKVLKSSDLEPTSPDYAWIRAVFVNLIDYENARARKFGFEPSKYVVMQMARVVLQLAKNRVSENARQSGNRERKEVDRNTKIQNEYARLTKTMSQRAAARRIKSHLRLRITEERIRQIGKAQK